MSTLLLGAAWILVVLSCLLTLRPQGKSSSSVQPTHLAGGKNHDSTL